jgi:hypothetical protein
MPPTNAQPVGVTVLTREFLARGFVHVRDGTGMAWLLNAEERPALAMTGLGIYGRSFTDPPTEGDLLYRTEFAAVPKAQVLWLAGGAPDRTLDGHGRVPRPVHLLYADHVLTGTLNLRTEVRLSDFTAQLMPSKPFVTLYDARVLRPATGGELAEVQYQPFLTVNLRNVGGIYDVRGGREAS